MINEYITSLFEIPKNLYNSMYISQTVPIGYALLAVSYIISWYFSRNFRGYQRFSVFALVGFMIYSTGRFWMKI